MLGTVAIRQEKGFIFARGVGEATIAVRRRKRENQSQSRGFEFQPSFKPLYRNVFPNALTVESDFFGIPWEKNAYRTSLVDFSLD